jgi:hypothetical protein
MNNAIHALNAAAEKGSGAADAIEKRTKEECPTNWYERMAIVDQERGKYSAHTGIARRAIVEHITIMTATAVRDFTQAELEQFLSGVLVSETKTHIRRGRGAAVRVLKRIAMDADAEMADVDEHADLLSALSAFERATHRAQCAVACKTHYNSDEFEKAVKLAQEIYNKAQELIALNVQLRLGGM